MWGTVKKLPVISVELTFFQVYLIAELFGCPVFFIMAEHLHAKCLKIPVQPFFFWVMSLPFFKSTGCRDQKLADQCTLHCFRMRTAGDVFLLQLADDFFYFFRILRIKYLVLRKMKIFCRILLCNKMKITVPELLYCLIVLHLSWCVQDAGIFSGNQYTILLINFHRSFQQ